MRVVVNIPPGSHPELLKELEKTPPRERAERLRMLATFGLIHMSQPNLPTASLPMDGHAPDGEVARSVTAAIGQLLLLADDYYQSGANGLSYLPLRAHIAIAVAARVYRQIGVQIAATGYGWHQGRQVTSRVIKLKCSLHACGSIWRRFWPRVPHRKQLHDGLEGLPYVR